MKKVLSIARESMFLQEVLKILALAIAFLLLFLVGEVFPQNPTYTLNLTNDQQIDERNYELDIYLLRTGGTAFEYANNAQYFININPAIINGGALTFTILPGTCELNLVQQILTSKVSFDPGNSRLRIAAHTPSGAGTGTMISNTGLGTRLGRFRVTNTVTFAATQANLTWYNGPTGFYTKMFAYVGALNVEITNSSGHLININNPPLPVVMSAFNSSVSRNDVKLNWTTESEINNSGFDVERTPVSSQNNWQKIGFVAGYGTTNEQKHYALDDKKLNTGKYKYRLKQMDYNGNFAYYNLSNEVEVGKPKEFSMSQNYPNPGNPRSKIDFELPVPGKVSIKIYDLLGREVSTLINEDREAGYYSAEFDGTNLTSGVYIYRIIVEATSLNFSKTLKMLLIK
jgi:type IX secretion system substrate protein